MPSNERKEARIQSRKHLQSLIYEYNTSKHAEAHQGMLYPFCIMDVFILVQYFVVFLPDGGIAEPWPGFPETL